MAAEGPRGGNVRDQGDGGVAGPVSRRREGGRDVAEANIAATTGVGPVLGRPALLDRLGEGGQRD